MQTVDCTWTSIIISIENLLFSICFTSWLLFVLSRMECCGRMRARMNTTAVDVAVGDGTEWDDTNNKSSRPIRIHKYAWARLKVQCDAPMIPAATIIEKKSDPSFRSSSDTPQLCSLVCSSMSIEIFFAAAQTISLDSETRIDMSNFLRHSQAYLRSTQINLCTLKYAANLAQKVFRIHIRSMHHNKLL